MSRNVDDTKNFANEYFGFLVSEFGFAKIPDYYVSGECNFGYRKDNIEINFGCDADGTSLPLVTLLDHRKVTRIGKTDYPDSYPLTEIEIPEEMKKIFSARKNRVYPKDKKNNHNESYQESDNGYEILNRDEINIVVREYASIIKQHPEILSGDLSPFIKKEKKKKTVYPPISSAQTNGTLKSSTQNRKEAKKNFWSWARSLFQ